ncbi:SRPBCC family protein [Amycolatopsis jejuensis]|uniref:SRPBCC family protein n=1 Tax=Amycolatopsis jejuensis TaxID=330084 RepID=UPI000527F13F|nr:SRPBCC domain-containing protein [Amycolatopsis jejuensis]
MNSFTTEITVDRTPEEVFTAITDVRAWFSKTITGNATKPGDEFSFVDKGIPSSRIQVTAAVPGRRIDWHVEEAYLAFVDEHDEWTGTSMTFDLTPTEGGTRLRFTHHGLTPDQSCYGECSQCWTGCVNTSLYELLTTGVGQPIPV